MIHLSIQLISKINKMSLPISLGLIISFMFFSCSNKNSDFNPLNSTLLSDLSTLKSKPLGEQNQDSLFYICNRIYFDEYFKDSVETRIIAFNTSGELLELDGRYDSIEKMVILCESSFDASTPPEIKIDLYRFHARVQNSLGEYDKALNRLNSTRKLWDDINNKKTVAIISSELGRTFNGIHKYDSAIYFYQMALNHFDTTHQLLNQSIMLNNISNSFADQGINKTALDYLLKSTKLAEEINDSEMLSVNYNNLGLMYKESGKLDSALYFFYRSQEYIPDSVMNISKIMTYNNLGNTYKKLNRLKESKDAFDIVYKYCDENNIKPGILRAQIGLGDISYLKKDYINAQSYYLSAYNLAKETNNIRFQLNALECLAQNNLTEQEINVFETYKTISDSINLNEKQEISLELDSKYQNKKQIAENLVLQLKIEKESYHKWLSYSLFFLTLAWVIILIIQFRKRQFKHQRKMALAEKSIFHNELVIAKKENTLKLNEAEKKQAELNLTLKNQEISHYVLSQSVFNNRLTDLKDEISEFIPKLRAKKDRDAMERLMNQISHNSKKPLTEFEEIFKSIYPDFFEKLAQQYPELSTRERQICALLKLNLNSKDIAQITHIANNSIETMRYRIRKKMNLESNQSLQKVINKI